MKSVDSVTYRVDSFAVVETVRLRVDERVFGC